MTSGIIRLARYTDDVERFAVLGRLDHERSACRDIPYDVGSVMRLLVKMVDQRMLFVAESGNEIVGAIGGLCFPADYNDSISLGSMRFWWVDIPYQKTRLALRLLGAIEAQAGKQGCVRWFVSSVDVERHSALTRLFSARGYVLAEHVHMKAFS